MKKRYIILIAVGSVLLLCAITAITLFLYVPNAEYGFARQVSEEAAALRLTVVETAENWLGTEEGSDEHHAIIDLYNAHEPLAQGYEVTYTDNWCSTFVSCVAIECGLTDIIPTECGCQRQIGLFNEIGCWEEDDGYTPLPGDYIFYAWDDNPIGDCTGWADHVGIVVGTWGPFIKVIEGNKDDSVAYRYIWIGHPEIRGYGLPYYHKAAACS